MFTQSMWLIFKINAFKMKENILKKNQIFVSKLGYRFIDTFTHTYVCVCIICYIYVEEFTLSRIEHL